MAVNGQYSDPPFGMAGVDSTGAPGSAGAPPPQADNAFTTQVTMPYQSVQNTAVPMVGVGADDTALPGQLYEGFSGLGPSDTASTGAGMGSGHQPHPNAGR